MAPASRNGCEVNRTSIAIGATFALGIGCVMPTAANAAENKVVVDSIISGVLNVLEVDASAELVAEIASDVSIDVFDPSLVADVAAALDSNADAIAVVTAAFDSDGDGEITNKDVAALKLLSREAWVALEEVLETHDSDDDDEPEDEFDDDSSTDSSESDSSGSGSAGSRDSDDSTSTTPGEQTDDDTDDSSDDNSDDDESDEEEPDDDQDD